MSDGGRTAFGDGAPEDGVVRCTEQVATPEPMDSAAVFGDHADIINIAVVGPSGVGKTALIQSFIVCSNSHLLFFFFTSRHLLVSEHRATGTREG